MKKTSTWSTWTYAISCYLFRGLCVISGKAPRVTGKENIPTSGGYLVVINHQNFMDPWYISWCFPLRNTIRWLAKGETSSARRLIDDPTSSFDFSRLPRFLALFIGVCVCWVVRNCGVLFVEPDDPTSRLSLKSMMRANRILSHGGVIGIFPEGRIKKAEGKETKASESFIVLAKRTGVPIVPVFIDTHRIIIGKPVKVSQECVDNPSDLATNVMELIYSQGRNDDLREREIWSKFRIGY